MFIHSEKQVRNVNRLLEREIYSEITHEIRSRIENQDPSTIVSLSTFIRKYHTER